MVATNTNILSDKTNETNIGTATKLVKVQTHTEEETHY